MTSLPYAVTRANTAASRAIRFGRAARVVGSGFILVDVAMLGDAIAESDFEAGLFATSNIGLGAIAVFASNPIGWFAGGALLLQNGAMLGYTMAADRTDARSTARGMDASRKALQTATNVEDDLKRRMDELGCK